MGTIILSDPHLSWQIMAVARFSPEDQVCPRIFAGRSSLSPDSVGNQPICTAPFLNSRAYVKLFSYHSNGLLDLPVAQRHEKIA